MEFTDPETPAPCWNCKAIIAQRDKYCRYCGKGQGSNVPWYYSHFGIIVMTLFGLGPFSLGLVWKSPRLSREAKVAYTLGILVFTWYVAMYIYNAYLAINSLLTGALSGFGLQ